MKILITGGAQRIGEMLTKQLAAKGHQIAIHYHKSTVNAQKIFAEIGGEKKGHYLIQANLENLDDTAQVIPKLIKNWGKPNALINNASTYFRRGVSHFTNEELLADYTINFLSPFILMRDFKNFCQTGKIINILDRRIDLIEPAAGPYAFAKKSLRDATQACAKEWYPEICVNAIAPGPILQPNETCEEAQTQRQLTELKKSIEILLSQTKNGTITYIE